MATDTAWRAGRFDTGGGPKQILFGRMYEDVEIERSAFPRGSRVFSIASAGCTAIRLSAEHEVTAVDINPVQLAYAQRRAAGAPMETGSAERVMDLGRCSFPLLGWTRGTIDTFLALNGIPEQVAFWRVHLDTWRFRQSFDAATSRTILRLTYAEKFLDITPPKMGRVLRSRMERCWSRHPNRTNLYARSLLRGDPGPDAGLEGAETIRFACADAALYLETCLAGSFDAFTVSNILDGATAQYRHRLFAALKYAAARNAVVVMRSFAEPDLLSPTNYAAVDRSMLWGITEVTEVGAL
jgi:S-adenosylmethionine:diacylglycerol 3-amino-3-carboxypropyl transferase